MTATMPRLFGATPLRNNATLPPAAAHCEQQALDLVKVAEFEGLVQIITSEAEPAARLRALGQLRAALAAGARAPVREALEAGVVPVLTRCLDTQGSPAAALEAAWALTNLAAAGSEETAALLQGGAGEALLGCVRHPALAERADLCEQLLWALANIASDSDTRLRDHLLAAGAVNTMGYLFSQMPGFAWSAASRTEVLRTKTWLLSSLCRGTPAPALEEVECLFDYFVQVITGTEDARMLADALWGLCHLVGGAEGHEDGLARVDRILAAGFAPGAAPPVHPAVQKVVQCIGRGGDVQNPLPVPALQLLGAMLRLQEPRVADGVLGAGALEALTAVLLDGAAPEALRRDAAWALANVAAGTPKQAQALVSEPRAWRAVCMGLEQASSKQIRRECAWAVAGVAKRPYGQWQGEPEPQEVLQLLTRVLKQDTFDADLTRALLDATDMALRRGEELGKLAASPVNELALTAEGAGLVEELEALKRSPEASLQRKAAFLIDAYFSQGGQSLQLPPTKEDKARGDAARSSIAGDASPTRKRAYQFGA